MTQPSLALPARGDRGATIIEAMVSLVVLAIGMLGLASLQIVGVRANFFGKQLGTASELALDLAEGSARWDYTDARLAPTGPTISSTSATQVTDRWDLFRADAVPSTAKHQFGEAPTSVDPSNALTPSALALGATTYKGLSGDVLRDGSYQFRRYWTVYNVDFSALGTPQGKLVQIVVRWKEPGLGWRQVKMSSYIPNPSAGFL